MQIKTINAPTLFIILLTAIFARIPGLLAAPSSLSPEAAFEGTKPLATKAPWPGTYKIHLEEKERLTAADVIGPDGHIYPDFTFAGIPGGIPKPPVRIRLKEMGAHPGMDISKMLEDAAGKVKAAGGGAVLIDEGEYYLDEPVIIFDSNVAIIGAGSTKTRLLFRYHVPAGEIRFFRLKPGQDVSDTDYIEFHANPKNLTALELRCDERSLARKARADHWGNTFSFQLSAASAIRTSGTGMHHFVGIAEYSDGKRVEQPIDLKLVTGGQAKPAPGHLGAINFFGCGSVSAKIALTHDGKRGDGTLSVQSASLFAPGDFISLVAPATERWKNLVGSTSGWNFQARNIYQVMAVDGTTLTLDQPLRITFPLIDGSYVEKLHLISNCGVQGIHLEQVVVPGQGPKPPTNIPLSGGWYPIEDLWISGVIIGNGWNCWLQDVTIKNAGRNPAYFPFCKHIEVRDCLFDEALFKGGGGTAYVGFDSSWDCLIDHIEVKGMRHAPNSQWNSAGNVVRNSRFDGSDGQWHAGFTHENLYECNFIDSHGNGGSTGHGLYASGPSVAIHGPQGPRNVVYNNDIISRVNCIHMLGGNEAWMFLHNRFVTDKGCAVFAKEKSFDHLIEDNVFVLRQAVLPAVQLGADSVGVELVKNAFYGVISPLAGFAGNKLSLAVNKGNSITTRVPFPIPARPSPKVPSLFQWQRDNADAIKRQRDSLRETATRIQ